jgi:signal transduction histidine kinase
MKNSIGNNVRRFEEKQIIFSVLGLILLIGVSTILNTLHLNSVALQSTKFMSRMVELALFREVGLTLEDAKLDSFTEIHYLSDRPGRSFHLPAGSELTSRHGAIENFLTERITVPTYNPLNPNDSDRIVYVFDRFRLLPYALGIWLLLMLVSLPQTYMMKRKVTQQYERELRLERDRAQLEGAKLAKHNLRTPLVSLMRFPALLPDSMGEDKKIFISTINQIREEIDQIGHDRNSQFSDKREDEIYDSLAQAIRVTSASIPKGIHFSYEVDDNLASAKVPHIPLELRALIGNIVNNSVDAIGGNGTIFLKVKDLETDLEIEVHDTGHGIAPEIIGKIFDDGFTQKENGTGVGLHHAKKWIEKWDGTIEAYSASGLMTVIKIKLPVKDRASWYIPRIRIERDQPVVVVEDQESARQLWRIRFDESGIEGATILSSAEEFERLAPNLVGQTKPALFFDYDLGSKKTGMDLFADFKQPADKYLVTGHFDEKQIRVLCESGNIYLLPKTLLAEVPIVLAES